MVDKDSLVDIVGVCNGISDSEEFWFTDRYGCIDMLGICNGISDGKELGFVDQDGWLIHFVFVMW